MALKQATRVGALLRLAFSGTGGVGKTYSALWLAWLLSGGGKVGVIDSEKGSASLYTRSPSAPAPTLEQVLKGEGRWPFLVDELEDGTIQEYLSAIDEIAAAGCSVLVIDSFSHTWTAVLELVDKMGGWVKAGKVASPLQKKLIHKVLSYPGHVICCFRAEARHVIEQDEKGRNSLRKIGLKPVARDQTDYEFTVWLDVDTEGNFLVSKTRCGHKLPLGMTLPRTDVPRLAKLLQEWLSEGEPRTEVDELADAIRFTSTLEQLDTLRLERLAKAPETVRVELRAVYAAQKAKLSEEVGA